MYNAAHPWCPWCRVILNYTMIMNAGVASYHIIYARYFGPEEHHFGHFEKSSFDLKKIMPYFASRTWFQASRQSTSSYPTEFFTGLYRGSLGVESQEFLSKCPKIYTMGQSKLHITVNHGGVQNAIRKITPSYLALFGPLYANFCLSIAFSTTSIIFQTPTRVRMAWVGQMLYSTSGTETMFWREQYKSQVLGN